MSDQSQQPTRRLPSRYDRPRTYVSWGGILIGLLLGAGGGLFYAWNVDPVEQIDIAPWQLNEDDRNQYMVAVLLNHAHEGQLAETIQELVALRLPGNDPIQAVADIACEMARAGYVDSNSGYRAMRNVVLFYQGQGKSGCADELVPLDASPQADIVQVVLPTATPRPPATKTPTPPVEPSATSTPRPLATPTQPPQRAFELVRLTTFCDSINPGTIEVRVVDFNAQGIPGQRLRVRWNDGDSLFVTGLKPERGIGYADFEMEPGLSYIVEMPGLSDPTTPIVADTCTLEGGGTATTSYQVVFRGN